MYERFTDRARKVMQLANQEAQRFNHEYIGTEHILLGLVKEGVGVAVQVLHNLHVDLRRIQREVEKIIQPGTDVVTVGKVPQTPRAKKVIEHSIEEARNLNHNYVGTEHLLLGLIREQEGLARAVLTNLGVRLEEVRAEVLSVLGHDPAAAEVRGGTGGEPPAAPATRKTPALDSFGRDLTELARKGTLEPVIGRSGEIARVVQVLCCRGANNPVLVGEPGVGKTAVAEGLARLMARGEAPGILPYWRVVALDPLALGEGGGEHGKVADHARAVVDECRGAKDLLLLIEGLHAVAGGGAPANTAGAASVLRAALVRGDIRCVATATPDDYRLYVEKDRALAQRFRKVLVQEPDRGQTVAILAGLRERYGEFHRVKFTDDAVAAAVELSDLYLPERFFPQKAIHLLDEAGAFVRLRALDKPPDLAELEAEIGRVEREKENAVAEQDFNKAARVRDQADLLKKKRSRLVREWQEGLKEFGGPVDAEAVVETLSGQTGIPAAMIRRRDTSALRSRPRD
jgi:ATP-dependent Clp protease ATP-binding subunit ClpC